MRPFLCIGAVVCSIVIGSGKKWINWFCIVLVSSQGDDNGLDGMIGTLVNLFDVCSTTCSVARANLVLIV